MDVVTMDVVTMDVVTMDVVTMDVVTMDVVTMDVVTMDVATMDVVTMDVARDTKHVHQESGPSSCSSSQELLSRQRKVRGQELPFLSPRLNPGK